MRFPIRDKLIVAISILMVLLFSLAAYLFTSEKKVEMADDIYVNTLAFAKLTAPNVANDYELYLAQNGFVYFNREMKLMFERNRDVSKIMVVSYGGEILYDSSIDTEKKYEGVTRNVDDGKLLAQVQAGDVSFTTVDGVTYFLKEDDTGEISYVDELEKPLTLPAKGTRISYMIVPSTEKYSVLYGISYENLDNRVAEMAKRIGYLALFGILVGVLFALILSGQITKPVLKLVEGVYKIAQGDLKTRVDIKTSDEINFLGEAVNKMAGDLEVSLEAKLYKERVASELKIASAIQKQLIPEKLPEVEGLEISAGLIPAEEIGGDMYDFLPLEGGKKLLMYLGDVTGHGVPAGIVSSIASALFYGYSTFGDLKKIMVEVNRVLKAKTMPNMFMTLCLMLWDTVSKKFYYVSAGHEQIVHYKANGKKAELLPAGGIALAMSKDISSLIKVEEVDFQVGDYLVIYSDGIPEAWKNEKEMYGMERLTASVEDFGHDLITALAMKEAVLSDVEQFVQGYKQTDDITIIVLKRTK